jgi:hypothetical protein
VSTAAGSPAPAEPEAVRTGEGDQGSLPDPSRPPGNRGPWEEAALTNVAITEVVKRIIGSVTHPWNK